jgi:hypothetical protein
MLFPREFVEVHELTPEREEFSCIAYIPIASGPATRGRGPVIDARRTVSHDGKNWKASRLSYSLNVSKISSTPESLKDGIVCHTCDNPWCINPKHLYLESASQNTKDIYNRNENIIERKSKSAIGNQNKKGKTHSDEFKAALSERLIGNQHKKGKKESEETKSKKSEIARKRWEDPEYRTKMISSMMGRKHSEETKKKIGEANKKTREAQ